MVTVKFFAGAREAAGESSTQVEADSVQAAIDAVIVAHGDVLARMISISKIWLNGEPAEPAAPVSSGDEIAVLPPVSGGI
ncbi:MAG: MoaD/ThiS family protein [Acidimicrobiaceae bacterium]|nr:MoaD/ThiS family protein [Acidimicrobiaceae bacterium]